MALEFCSQMQQNQHVLLQLACDNCLSAIRFLSLIAEMFPGAAAYASHHENVCNIHMTSLCFVKEFIISLVSVVMSTSSIAHL